MTLGARLHYGHPDCFDFGFVLTEGGTSKMSKTINVSEDIFGGINVLLRGGSVSYVDYLQVGAAMMSRSAPMRAPLLAALPSSPPHGLVGTRRWTRGATCSTTRPSASRARSRAAPRCTRSRATSTG